FRRLSCLLLFPLHRPATLAFYSLSLHDALPIFSSAAIMECQGRIISATGTSLITYTPATVVPGVHCYNVCPGHHSLRKAMKADRSEEHTSELQSRFDLVCRLLLEKKKTVEYPYA